MHRRSRPQPFRPRALALGLAPFPVLAGTPPAGAPPLPGDPDNPALGNANAAGVGPGGVCISSDTSHLAQFTSPGRGELGQMQSPPAT